MAIPTWRLNKEIPFSADYTAKFFTLYEDTRDIMCDSPRPEWAVSQRRNNRLVTVENYKGVTVFSLAVSKDEGNAMYLEMKSLDHHGYGTAECKEWLRRHGAIV